MSLTEIKLTFGKYSGYKLETIRLCDPQYVVWLHDSAQLDSKLRGAVSAIYQDCLAEANKKHAPDVPVKRKSTRALGISVDFMGMASDNSIDGFQEVPNFGVIYDHEGEDSYAE